MATTTAIANTPSHPKTGLDSPPTSGHPKPDVPPRMNATPVPVKTK